MPDWQKAADAAKDRRAELGLTAEQLVARMPEEVRIDADTYRRFERNERQSYRRSSLSLISQALDWRPTALWDIAFGADKPTPNPELDELRERVRALEVVIEGLRQAIAGITPLIKPGDSDPS